MISWSELIKKLHSLGVLWGPKTKKLSGISDEDNFIEGLFTFDSVTRTISFPLDLPLWVEVDKYFRVTEGGGGNTGNLLRIESVDNVFNSIVVVEAIFDFSGSATLDGRIWAVIDNETIAKANSKGGTIYNVNNHETTGLADGSELAACVVDHYHETSTSQDDKGELVSTEYNSLGCRNLVKADCCDEQYVELGPQLVFDDDGNAITSKEDPDMGGC